MLKIIGIIAVILIIGVVGILIFASTKPDNFRVQRSTSIKAPPERIFALINDFHKWGVWSPWETKDPQMKRTFSGAPAGKGAIYEWDGNNNVGQGRMEITDAATSQKIVIKLDFIKPFEGHNVAEFTMRPSGDATNLTWSMDGPVPFIGKVMHVFLNMDKMIGTDFEAGLANLKTNSEK